MPDRDQKTEQATPKKRFETREKGQIVHSQELSTVVVITCGFLTVWFGFQIMVAQMKEMLVIFIGEFPSTVVSMGDYHHLGLVSLKFFVLMTAPVLTVLMLGSFLIDYKQAGGLQFATKALEWKFTELNPVTNWGKFFSMNSLMETFKAVLKLVLIGWMTWALISRDLSDIPNLSQNSVAYSLDWLARILLKLFLRLIWLFIVLAIADWAWQKWRFERDLKMTKEEVKEEHKQSEGDPKVKGKIRSMQMEILRKKMVAAVSTADVIVTNPEHFAVALKYDSDQFPAPRVVAKGADHLAFRIRQIARSKGILIMENKPLARFLYAKVKVGHIIPADVFETVAKVYAFLYQIKHRDQKI